MRTQDKVRVGQVWQDNASQRAGRTIAVRVLTADVAVCEVLTNSWAIQAVMDDPRTDPTSWPPDARGNSTYVPLARLQAPGFTLLTDAGPGLAPSMLAAGDLAQPGANAPVPARQR